MKVLAICASPRKGGNSDDIITAAGPEHFEKAYEMGKTIGEQR